MSITTMNSVGVQDPYNRKFSYLTDLLTIPFLKFSIDESSICKVFEEIFKFLIISFDLKVIWSFWSTFVSHSFSFLFIVSLLRGTLFIS